MSAPAPIAAEAGPRLDPEARLWLAVTALLYVIAAWRLGGYIHPDEHFQTLEWASAWLGATPIESLTWEHRAQIRPWLQPMLYAAVGRAFSPEAPFTFALACRLTTAAIAWLGVAALGLRYREWFPEAGRRRVAWVATATFYLAPALAVRTSSEALGAALLMLGLGLFTAPRARGAQDLLAAAIIGLAVTARYQLGFMAMGLIAWHFFERRPARALRAGLGVGLAVAAGLVLDRIGYGEWVLTPWRYLSINLLEGKAASFGEAPAWAYFGYIWHDLALPFNLVAIVALPLALLRSPRHPLGWALAPFVLAHAVIGHKEPRFLYPYLAFVAPLAAIAIGPRLGRPQGWQRRLLVGLVTLNLWWLLMDRRPNMQAGPWLEPFVHAQAPLHHGGTHPLGEGGLHTWLYAKERGSRPMPAAQAATSTAPISYYHYQRRGAQPPRALERACERLAVAPLPWAWLPGDWLTGSWGRRVFATEHRHAVYRCPK